MANFPLPHDYSFSHKNHLGPVGATGPHVPATPCGPHIAQFPVSFHSEARQRKLIYPHRFITLPPPSHLPYLVWSRWMETPPNPASPLTHKQQPISCTLSSLLHGHTSLIKCPLHSFHPSPSGSSSQVRPTHFSLLHLLCQTFLTHSHFMPMLIQHPLIYPF